MSEPLTREQSPTRFMIPRHFSFTRIDNENVEVVLATDYDALRAKLAESEQAHDVIRKLCEREGVHHPEAAINRLKQQLAETGGPAMIWTTEKPTKPGWYWWRGPMWGKEITRVLEVDSDDAGAFYVRREYYVNDLTGHWAGPLEPPHE